MPNAVPFPKPGSKGSYDSYNISISFCSKYATGASEGQQWSWKHCSM